jgi:hypothetical protein
VPSLADPVAETQCSVYGNFDTTQLAQLKYSHQYCSFYLDQLFYNTTREQSRFPPRVIRPREIEQHLTKEAIIEYMEKAMEWKTVNKFYYANVQCGMQLVAMASRILT